MKTKVRLVGIAVFALASLPVLASNTEDLVLNDGLGNTVTVNQAGAVTGTGTYSVISASGSGGNITFVGTLGQFSFDLDSGQAYPGTTLPALMNTTTINTEASVGAGTLTVLFSQTGYTSLTSTLAESASDTYTANTPNGSTASFTGYDNAAGTLNSTSDLIGTVLSSTDSSNPVSQSDSATTNYANTVSSGSLTEVITLGFKSAGTIDTGFAISNVATPEPASIVVLGSILLALAALFSKKLARRA